MEFIQADLLQWSPAPMQFDLIVTNFFLDCFRPDQLAELIPRIAAAAAPGACWLLSDFREPEAGWRKWRARLILQSMYAFFQCATNLPATRLTAPDAVLRQNDFVLRERRLFEWGLLHSDLWTWQGVGPAQSHNLTSRAARSLK